MLTKRCQADPIGMIKFLAVGARERFFRGQFTLERTVLLRSVLVLAGNEGSEVGLDPFLVGGGYRGKLDP